MSGASLPSMRVPLLFLINLFFLSDFNFLFFVSATNITSLQWCFCILSHVLIDLLLNGPMGKSLPGSVLICLFFNFFFFYPRNHSLIIDQAIWTLIIASLGKKIQPLFMLDASESPNWAIILEPWNWRRLLMGEIHLRKYILIQSTFFAVKIASQGWQNPNIFVALPGEHDSHK